MSGKRTDEATNITEFAVISTIYTNKILFDLGVSSSIFTTKSPELKALTFYLPGDNQANVIQIDRQFILTGTPAELAKRLNTNNRAATIRNPRTQFSQWLFGHLLMTSSTL